MTVTHFDAERPPQTLKPLQVAAPDIEAWLIARDPRAIGSYRELAPEEYARSFTAAQTAGADVIDDLYFGMVDNVARGGSEQDFSRMVTPILKAKGWLGGDDGAIAKRVELIYDTNLRLARSAGRWTRYQSTRMALPYVRGVTVGDERVRHPPKSPHSDHRAFDGIILPVDHPFVAKWWPPLGFRCRCNWIQMTRSQFARYGGTITTDEELDEREARLGQPVFASPAAPLPVTLQSMVASSNEGPRMPGLPMVDPAQTEAAGRALWSEVLLAQAGDELGAMLAKLFGL